MTRNAWTAATRARFFGLFVLLFAAPAVHAQVSLSFSNYSLESGTALSAGAVYRFDDVTAGIDALVTISGISGGATLLQIDDASPSGANWSPQVSGTPNNVPNPQVDFLVAFVTADTSTPIVLDSVEVACVDIDGSATRREFTVLDGFEYYTMETDPPADLLVTSASGKTVFTSNGADYSGTSPDTTQATVTALYTSVSQIAISVGQSGSESSAGSRVSSIHFTPDLVPYSDPDTTYATLPVELVSFYAMVNDGDLLLRWTTASETNTSGFEIELASSQSFSAVAFVNALGGEQRGATYSRHLADIAPGAYRVRLRMIDNDGSYAYGPVVEVLVSGVSGATLAGVYPNPAREHAAMAIELSRPSAVVVRVYDVAGRQVRGTPSTYLEAGVHKIDLDVSGLPPGIYLYRLETVLGAETGSIAVVQ